MNTISSPPPPPPGQKPLTFSAVVSLPARETDAVACGGAFVVAEVVIAGTAQYGTAATIVMFVARDSVFVLHHGMRRAVFVLRPILSNVQPSLRRKARDQRLPCNNKSRHHGNRTSDEISLLTKCLTQLVNHGNGTKSA